MSHEVEQFEDGTASFFAARTPAWHTLGTVTSEAQTAAEAIEVADLTGVYHKLPVYAREAGTSAWTTIPGQYGIVRDHPKLVTEDNPLGRTGIATVGQKYRIIQIPECFA